MTGISVVEVTDTLTVQIQESDGRTVIVDATPTVDLRLAATGLQGPAGPQGPTGPSGGEGIVYNQDTPAASWPINHGLGRPVGVVIRLASGEIVQTEVDQSDMNVAVLVFPTPEAGKAFVI